MTADYSRGYEAGYAAAELEFRKLLELAHLVRREGTEKKVYFCPICGKQYSYGKALGYHVAVVHRGAERRTRRDKGHPNADIRNALLFE